MEIRGEVEFEPGVIVQFGEGEQGIIERWQESRGLGDWISIDLKIRIPIFALHAATSRRDGQRGPRMFMDLAPLINPDRDAEQISLDFTSAMRNVLAHFGALTERKEPMEQLRQGDLLLTKIGEDADIQNAISGLYPSEQIQPEDGRVILAKGERTGHAHTVDAEVAQLFTAPVGGDLRLIVAEPTQLEHQEHEAIDLDEGVYEVRQQIDWREGPAAVPRFDYD